MIPNPDAANPGPSFADRAHGCLLAGACGDALGAAVEFDSLEDIKRRFGPSGIRDFAPAYGRIGAITDDTQMTLFTAEGILRAAERYQSTGIWETGPVMVQSYLRWLLTQGERPAIPVETDGWLFSVKELHHKREPGRTCISALRSISDVSQVRAANHSKGTGGIMRIAPWAIFAAANPQSFSASYAFDKAMESARITHGHPTGYLAAGAFAAILYELLLGRTLEVALDVGTEQLMAHGKHADESLRLLKAARRLARAGTAPEEAIPRLGEGWVAEEALAIAAYCASIAEDLRSGIASAANITGDSDTTGLLTGELLGAIWGANAVPEIWTAKLETVDQIGAATDKLLASHTLPRGWG